MKRLLWLIVALSLIPGLLLAYRRHTAETGSRTVTLIMDEVALAEQAGYFGLSSFELAERYRALGLNGIALYEDTIESLTMKGQIATRLGNDIRNQAITAGAPVPNLPPNSTLITELEPGALEPILLKNTPAPHRIELEGRTWFLFPGNARGRPAGADRATITQWSEAGYDIAYRPRNFPNMQGVGLDFPAEANYLIYASIEVAGHPNALEDTIAASQPFLTGIIEGTRQDGMNVIIGEIPSTRVFPINQDWFNTLRPDELVDKYLLAANERGARLLYVRPYTSERMGDMVENTERFIRGLSAALQADGFTVAPVVRLEYDTDPLLRLLSALGVVAGLALLAMMYPGGWGVFVSAAILGLGVVAGGGLNWDALALAAALVFPVIGYGLLPERLHSFGLATLISIAGAVLLAAVGSDRQAMLAATPFAGVAATLVVPPALFLFHYALRYRRPAEWVVDFWNRPIRLGDIGLAAIAAVALFLVFVRRGNFPVIPVTGGELAVRDFLSSYFARPRFKELVGHPLALLALGNREWPAWIKGLLLTGGVVAQATILNSFSHYHTPLLISLERTLVAFFLSLLIGLVLVPIARLVTGGMRRWLASAATVRKAA